jgi:hypothetical protein
MLKSVHKNKKKVQLPIKKILIAIERIQFDNIEFYQSRRISPRQKLNKKKPKAKQCNPNK